MFLCLNVITRSVLGFAVTIVSVVKETNSIFSNNWFFLSNYYGYPIQILARDQVF